MEQYVYETIYEMAFESLQNLLPEEYEEGFDSLKEEMYKKAFYDAEMHQEGEEI